MQAIDIRNRKIASEASHSVLYGSFIKTASGLTWLEEMFYALFHVCLFWTRWSVGALRQRDTTFLFLLRVLSTHCRSYSVTMDPKDFEASIPPFTPYQMHFKMSTLSSIGNWVANDQSLFDRLLHRPAMAFRPWTFLHKQITLQSLLGTTKYVELLIYMDSWMT